MAIAASISPADLPFLIWLGIGVLTFAYVVVRRAVRNRISDSWMQLQGTVESTTVEVQKRGEMVVQVARIAYSYSYEGEYYAGFYTKDFVRQRSAEEFLESFPKGTTITIRSNPRRPGRSVMRDDDNTSVAVAVALRRKP